MMLFLRATLWSTQEALVHSRGFLHLLVRGQLHLWLPAGCERREAPVMWTVKDNAGEWF